VKLPEGWSSTTLDKLLVQIVGGGTPSKANTAFFRGIIPFMTVKDMKDRFPTDTIDHISNDAVKASATSVVPADTLIVATRMSLGKVARPRFETAINQDLKALFIAEGIDKTFIEHWWRWRSGHIQSLGTGTTVKGIRLEDIRSLEIDVPPAGEQKRIADKLDAALARVDACRERLDRVPFILKGFRQAVLAAATSGKLTEEWRTGNPTGTTGQSLLKEMRARHHAYSVSGLAKRARGVQGDEKKALGVQASKVPEPVEDTELSELPIGWTWSAGAEIVEPGAEIVYGIVQPGPKLPEGVPYIRGMDIENGKILEGQLLKTSPAIAARYSRSSLEGGDVLLGIIRATKVAIVPASLKGANITQGTARFRPSPAIRTRYLAIALEAPSTQRWLHAHYRGIDMPGLNLADVRRVPIPLPSLPEQDEIVRRVDALLSCADRLEVRYTAASAQVELLTPALLAKAFGGGLVPQDPNDEPASMLLERIRATRAAVGEKPARKARTERKPMQTTPTTDTLKEIIRGLPSDQFTFDDLRRQVSADYETLKDLVFALLSEAPASVKQVFDTEANTMRLVRVR
jgi:type I restriction enzyme S subunit